MESRPAYSAKGVLTALGKSLLYLLFFLAVQFLAGIVYAAEQMVDLVANGVRGVHVYTMNKPDVAAGIAENLSKVLGRG